MNCGASRDLESPGRVNGSDPNDPLLSRNRVGTPDADGQCARPTARRVEPADMAERHENTPVADRRTLYDLSR